MRRVRRLNEAQAEAQALLREFENYHQLGKIQDLKIVVIPQTDDLNTIREILIHNFGPDFADEELVNAIRNGDNKYYPDYKLIRIIQCDKLIIAHERFHAKIYDDGLLTPGQKREMQVRMQQEIIPEFSFKAILNYFQDISVNRCLMTLTNNNEYSRARFLARLHDKISSSLTEEQGPKPLEDFSQIINLIQIVFLIINYQILLEGQPDPNNFVQVFCNISARHQEIYDMINGFVGRSEGRLVEWNDYEQLYDLIVDYKRNWEIQTFHT